MPMPSKERPHLTTRAPEGLAGGRGGTGVALGDSSQGQKGVPRQDLDRMNGWVGGCTDRRTDRRRDGCWDE